MELWSCKIVTFLFVVANGTKMQFSQVFHSLLKRSQSISSIYNPWIVCRNVCVPIYILINYGMFESIAMVLVILSIKMGRT